MATHKRSWFNGRTTAFQADNAGSIPAERSNSVWGDPDATRVHPCERARSHIRSFHFHLRVGRRNGAAAACKADAFWHGQFDPVPTHQFNGERNSTAEPQDVTLEDVGSAPIVHPKHGSVAGEVDEAKRRACESCSDSDGRAAGS